MTDYEKLLEEADRVHSAFGGGDTGIIARLAAALREVTDERDGALGVGCDEASEQLRQHVASVADTCEYMGARGDAQALRKLASEHRTAQAEVETVRAEVRDAKAEAEKANDSAWGTAEELRGVRAECEAMRVVCDAARAYCFPKRRTDGHNRIRERHLIAALRALDARGQSRPEAHECAHGNVTTECKLCESKCRAYNSCRCEP